MPNRFFKSVQINRNMAVYCLRAARRRSKRRRLLLLAASLLILHTGQSRKRSKTTRSIWQREWLGRRDDKGAYNTLLSELRREDEGSFLNFLRLSPGLFQDLLSKVSPLIQRSDTFFRKAISPGMRLAITMRYLATGESFKSLSFLFRVANNKVGTIVPETCGAIYQVLAKDYFKGVFVFKGKKAAAKIEDYLEGDTSLGNEKERMSVCDDLWETIHQRIQILQSDVNTRLFDDLLEFVRKAHTGFTNGQDCRTGAAILSEIPTAALITGVNTPDHALMFSNLATMLEEMITPHVAVLRSKDCANLRSLMAKMLGQLMMNTDMMEEVEGEEQDSVSLRGVSCTMSVLASWYFHKSKRKSPKKRKSLDGTACPALNHPPIVIILEDIEGFPASVLQDFVTICSNHLHELPLVLVLGIATAMTAVHRLLPHIVSSRLCMEKFQAPFSTDYLTQVINEVVLTADIPFKLGAKVFNLLLDLFLFHDFSVLNFITSLQFCMLDHFYSNPVSVLCQPTEEVLHHIKTLSHDHLEQIRRNMSFRKYVEDQPPKEQIALLEDDKYTKKKIVEFLGNLEAYHESFYPVLKCLHVFTGKLPKYPLGKQIRELYARCLGENVCDTPEYVEAMGLLRALSRAELVNNLSWCVECLSGREITGDLQEVAVKLQTLRDKFDNIEDLARYHDEEGSEENEEPEDLLPKKMDMFTLKQKLQEMEKKKKKLTVYEVLRNEVLDYLDSLFKHYLVCPQSLPLYEALYYSDVTSVRQHINGSPRTTIQNGLARPYYYLQNPGCQCDGGFIPSTLPDVCVAYKLHVECGRLINLYDWLQAFMTVLTPEEEEGNQKKKPDQIMQARFIRAVSELQLLGFIKPTKRKTDHVARLTWGGC